MLTSRSKNSKTVLQIPKSRLKTSRPEARECAKAESCATCAHCMREGDNGFCRRYPPSLRVDNGSSYVPVKLEWVCGEYVHESWSK
jgi:hypothetical protein